MKLIVENINIALTALKGNKGRAILTMLGIIIGVAAVVVLLSLGAGVQGSIRKQFEALRIDQITVFAIEDEIGRYRPLTMSMKDDLAEKLARYGQFTFMPQYETQQFARAGARETNTQIVGTTADYLRLVNRVLFAGRFFTAAEADTIARVAVIGKTTATRLFRSADPIGQNIRIGQLDFQVIGVVGTAPGETGSEAGNVLIIPLVTAQTRLNDTDAIVPIASERPVTSIIIQIDNATNVPYIVQQTTEVLRLLRRVAPDAPDDFFVLFLGSFLDTFTTIIGVFTLFLGVVAGISLLVGGIGVMNIMLVTVTERTREVGLRKAVGAQNEDIILQFLIEAVTITVIGGAIGVGLAFGLTTIATALTQIQVSVQPTSIALALAVSIAIGIFFGIYPAQRASRLNVIDALRFE